MGKYGYGSGWGSSWNSWGSGKKKGSVSGWEKSHFGGYNRVLTDYPYIKVDFDLDIKTGKTIASDLGSWTGDKLIKLYLLKAKELGLIDAFDTEEVEKMKYFQLKKYIVAKLDSEEVFYRICSAYSELAPMFEHYKEGIFESTIEMEVKDDQEGEGESGEGEDGESEEQNKEKSGKKGDGDGEEQESKGSASDGDGDEDEEGEEKETNSPPKKKGNGNRDGKKIQQLMNDISESKPFSPQNSLSDFSREPKFISFAQRVKTEKIKAYRFKPSEVKDSEALIKLLDIDFDPKSAEVKNLKLGKLDVTKIAEVPAGNISVYKQMIEEQDTKPFSVCILADMSGSMGRGNRIPSQLHIMNSLYLAMSQMLPPDKLYIYGHSGDCIPEIYTFYSPYDMDYERNIQYYNRGVNWSQNYDGPVIEAIHKKIRETNDDRIIFISLSDGEPCGNGYGGHTHNEELKRILERARRDNFVTVGIGIEAGHVSNLYSYAKPVWDLKTLPKDVSSIINQVVRAEFK